MRIRKCMALGGAILVFLGCLIIYRMADYTLYLQEEPEPHFQTIAMSSQIKPTHQNKHHSGINRLDIYKIRDQELKLKNSCKTVQYNFSTDIQMSEVYKEVKFDNIDGGVWKQGWNIEINPRRWNDNSKLKVFIVPHSHNDPGWLKTFEDYYTSETKNILNNMLQKLTTDQKKKFIWAEISFFSLWWDELSDEKKEMVKRLIQNGQLEIVTGGWVMNDEANTHYYSMITQLTEGHQWMKSNIQIEPKNGWTIDPFGESPTMAYLLKKMGLENLVIQRVHYSVKKFFAQMRNLEFRWRQFWDADGSNDLLTHMTPFYSYDIPHTCGPDPKICCQFDFRRLAGSGVTCPWRESPKPITKRNVAMRAEMLLDQYRKKAELYRTNALLVPLGDDFRYQYSTEWDNQFENYYKIIEYVNSKPGLRAEIKFATLNDYFKALAEESAAENFPTLVGDFFTYADRDDHYWSGYYTSRPFYKRMDRILMGYHRAAEILFSLGWSGKGGHDPSWLLAPETGFVEMLRSARRSLSLFQHHDGITGTARDGVMEDYARKMMTAVQYSKHVIQQVSHYLLRSSAGPHFQDPERAYFDFDDHRGPPNDASPRKVLFLGEGESKTLIFFNSLAHRRKELASVFASTPFVEIRDKEENVIPCQTSPFFSRDGVMDETRYEVSFVAEVPALGLNTYKIVETSGAFTQKNSFSEIKIFNYLGSLRHSKGFENVEVSQGREFSIENQRIYASFNERGHLRSITNKETQQFLPLHLDFVRYRAREGKEMSGAYLFLPDGNVTVLKEPFPLVRVFEGPLFARVEVKLKNVKHCLNLYKAPELDGLGIEIVNVVNILSESNYELAMRISSRVESGSEFYTDLNGFQVIKRTRLEKLPVQGNFYPMPSAAYIEDEKLRITVVSGQPLGVSSLRGGELEVVQDRRLNQDDNRGLDQAVMDNKITPNVFRILVEGRLENCKKVSPLLSINAYKSSQSLLNPLFKMISASEVGGSYSPVGTDLDADLHLVGARTLDEEANSKAGFVFHRPHLDFCFADSPSPSDGIINLHSFLPNNFGDDVWKTSLSFLKEEEASDKREDQLVCRMDFLPLILS